MSQKCQNFLRDFELIFPKKLYKTRVFLTWIWKVPIFIRSDGSIICKIAKDSMTYNWVYDEGESLQYFDNLKQLNETKILFWTWCVQIVDHNYLIRVSGGRKLNCLLPDTILVSTDPWQVVPRWVWWEKQIVKQTLVPPPHFYTLRSEISFRIKAT